MAHCDLISRYPGKEARMYHFWDTQLVKDPFNAHKFGYICFSYQLPASTDRLTWKVDYALEGSLHSTASNAVDLYIDCDHKYTSTSDWLLTCDKHWQHTCINIHDMIQNRLSVFDAYGQPVIHVTSITLSVAGYMNGQRRRRVSCGTHCMYTTKTSLSGVRTDINMSDFSVSSHPRELVQRIPAGSGMPIKELWVTTTQSSVNVTVATVDCSPLPLFKVRPVPASGEANISYEANRTNVASPMNGEFSLKFLGQQISGLDPMATAAEFFSRSSGMLHVDEAYGDCRQRSFDISWPSYPGDLDAKAIHVDTSGITGGPVDGSIVNTQRGGLNLLPIPGYLLRTPAISPEVHVVINNVPAECATTSNLDNNTCMCDISFPICGTESICHRSTAEYSGARHRNGSLYYEQSNSSCPNGCLYSYMSPDAYPQSSCSYSFSTPHVISVQPQSIHGGGIVRIHGTGFVGVVNISLGLTICHILNASQTDITCVVSTDYVASHQTPVTVLTGVGFASSSVTIALMPTVTSALPIVGSQMGGTKLTIQGSGFCVNSTKVEILFANGSGSSIRVSRLACEPITPINGTHLVCITPACPANMYTQTGTIAVNVAGATTSGSIGSLHLDLIS